MDSDVEFVAVDTAQRRARFPQSQTPSNRKPLRMVCRSLGSLLPRHFMILGGPHADSYPLVAR
jgi:hypothetical protein